MSKPVIKDHAQFLIHLARLVGLDLATTEYAALYDAIAELVAKATAEVGERTATTEIVHELVDVEKQLLRVIPPAAIPSNDGSAPVALLASVAATMILDLRERVRTLEGSETGAFQSARAEITEARKYLANLLPGNGDPGDRSLVELAREQATDQAHSGPLRRALGVDGVDGVTLKDCFDEIVMARMTLNEVTRTSAIPHGVRLNDLARQAMRRLAMFRECYQTARKALELAANGLKELARVQQIGHDLDEVVRREALPPAARLDVSTVSPGGAPGPVSPLVFGTGTAGGTAGGISRG